MSDLQASLLIIGIVVVAGVYGFNWFQERRLRRRIEEAVGGTTGDALMERTDARSVERVEPQLQSLPDEEAASPKADSRASDSDADEAAAEATESAVPPVPGFDPALDYIAEIRANAPIADSVLAALLSKTTAYGKPYRAAGFNAATGEWEDLRTAARNRYSHISIGLQLVNRAGALTAPQLTAFCEAVSACAAKAAGEATYPDAEAALKQARTLDAFCADVDIAIGVNIVAPADRSFAGSRIRGLAEAAGFKLEPEGVFHFRDDERRTLFTLDNHEPAPFIPEQIKSITTSGVTLLFDVPRVADGQQGLQRMLEVGGQLARALGGELVDDNRVALTEQGVAAIRQQLDAIARRMAAHGIEAGGERALRLFS